MEAPDQGEIQSPQDKYDSSIKQYGELTKLLREKEKEMNLEEKLQIDKKRHELHFLLLQIAKSIGVSKESVDIDVLCAEGKLKELDLDMPIIRLPLIGTYFKVDDTGQIINEKRKALFTGEDYSETPAFQRISTPGETFDGEIAALGLKPASDHGWIPHFTTEENIHGQEKEIKKWRERPYFALIFTTSTSRQPGQYDIPPYHHKRMEQRKALAKDFSLNLYEASDLSGHRDFDGVHVWGVEVPQERLFEVAKAIKESEKYWIREGIVGENNKTDVWKQEHINEQKK